MIRALYIGLGGAIGSIARYVFSKIGNRYFVGHFPAGTFIVNLIGAFLIGLVWGISERMHIPQNIRLFIIIGVLGGFTTFSAFGLDTFHLMNKGEIQIAIIYIVLTNVLGIALVFLGHWTANFLPHLL